MHNWDFDTVVVGAGVIGVAVGAALAQAGQSVLVLEAGPRPGEGTTARNSEVIHAGLYYPTGSLKHRMCVEGRRKLYAYLDRANVAYRKCGKLIVATNEAEETKLADIYTRGLENDVEGLSMLSREDVTRREPSLAAQAALVSAETGIFDSHGFVQSLLGVLETHDGFLALNAPFLGADPIERGFILRTGGSDPAELRTRRLINAAGLHAAQVAKGIAGVPSETIPQMRFAKGSYFRLSGKAPFSHLIYPVPVDGGLGVHATLDLSGAVRFGPDVEWLAPETVPTSIDYRVDPARRAAFATSIQSYWPGLDPDRLEPDYSGVRPKLLGPGAGFFDFEVHSEAEHGVPGLINLFGIESPGLTSSLAIADAVAEILAG